MVAPRTYSRPRPLAGSHTGKGFACMRQMFSSTDKCSDGLAWGSDRWWQVQALLEELQAEPDTAISLPELTEIVALLLA